MPNIVAAGAQRQISHVKEASIGVDPGTPYTIDRFLAGARIWNDIDDILSDELRPDRSVAPGVLGAHHVKGSFPFELSAGTFDDWIASAMCNAWTAAGTPNAGVSTTVVAGVTNTMAGTGIGTGIVAGDWVKISGFTLGNVANNGFFRATAASANLLTFAEAVNPDGTSRLVACASQAGIATVTVANIKPGTTEQSLSVEFANPDISVFQRALGMEVSKMSLAIPMNAKITGNFDAIGYSLPAPAATKYRTGTDAGATTSMPITSYNASCFLYLDAQAGITGVPIAIATAFDMALDNAMVELLPVFQTSLYDIQIGRSTLTGNITFAFTSSVYLAKALANTHIAIRLQILDPAGAGYAIDIPNVRLKMPGENTTENQIMHSYAWAAEKDASTINCKIWKLA